jgi:hypothetical protein
MAKEKTQQLGLIAALGTMALNAFSNKTPPPHSPSH